MLPAADQTRRRKNPALPIHNFLLSKRQAVESSFGYLKHRLLLVNNYARSVESFFVNVLSAIVTYSFNLTKKEDYPLFLDLSNALIS